MARSLPVPNSPTRTGIWLVTQILISYIIGLALPAVLYFVLDRARLDITGLVGVAAAAAIILSAALLLTEGILAHRVLRPPATPRRAYPQASALVIAGRGDGPQAVQQTVEALLSIPYLPLLQIVVACETERQRAVVEEMVVQDEGAAGRLAPFCLAGADDAAKIRAALDRVKGEFAGIFAAGQQPPSDAFLRAWLWLSQTADAVQGQRSIVREGLTLPGQLAAIERELPGTSALPISAPWAASGTWCIGNTYLTADLARRLASAQGPGADAPYWLVFDRQLVSWERGPRTFGHLLATYQWQESTTLRVPLAALRFRLGPGSRSRGLALARLHLQLWKPASLWLALQAPLLLAFTLYRHGLQHPGPRFPLFLALGILWWLAIPTAATGVAYLLAPPPTRHSSIWFLRYFILSIFGFAAVERTLARAVQIGVILGRWPRVQPGAAEHVSLPEGVPVALAEPASPVAPQTAVAPPTSTQRAVAKPHTALAPPVAQVLAAQLALLVADLQRQIAEAERCCRELEGRIDARQGAIHTEDLLSQVVEDALRFPLSPEEAEATRELLQAIIAGPKQVVILAALAEHVTVLDRVLQGYVRIRGAVQAANSVHSSARQ